jgi:hypothetical protein
MSAPNYDPYDFEAEALAAAQLAMLRSDRALNRAIKKMADADLFGASDEQIAEAVGRPVDWVRGTLRQWFLDK